MLAHYFEKNERSVNVVVVILKRLDAAFAHGFEPSEVNYAVDFVFGENLLHSRAIAHIGVVELNLLAGDLLYPLDAFVARVYHIVERDYFVAAVEKLDFGMRGDIPRAARDKYFFVHKNLRVFAFVYIIYRIRKKINCLSTKKRLKTVENLRKLCYNTMR